MLLYQVCSVTVQQMWSYALSRVPCLSASLYYTNREQKLETLGLGLESDNVN